MNIRHLSTAMWQNFDQEWPVNLVHGALFAMVGTSMAAYVVVSRYKNRTKAVDDSDSIQTNQPRRKQGLQSLESNTPVRDYRSLDIVPLLDFQWDKTEPRKYRPYKSRYNLTMAIETADVSELLEMDEKYVDRVMLRRRLLDEHSETVLGAHDVSKAAVDEFYEWMLTIYLPKRFPRMFQLRHNPDTGAEELWNDATSEFFSCKPLKSPKETLQQLGGLIEDDLLFLLPADDQDGYVLRAFVTCFPNGFNTKTKLGLKLRDIHKPVPGYKEKLEKSMDRWFSRLTAGTFVKRCNWTITTHDRLFADSGNHLYEGEEAAQIEIDVEDTYVRSERQMVHRLPQSGAILFSFKTYLYPIKEIKAEGLGPVLADAIDGLKSGNVPGMHFYKRAAVWGASVQRYLRS